MNIFTTSDVEKHLGSIALKYAATMVFIDKKLEFRFSPSGIDILQNDLKFMIDEKSRTIFMPFFDPIERTNISRSQIASVCMLMSCLNRKQLNVTNRPSDWSAAYSKSYLVHIGVSLNRRSLTTVVTNKLNMRAFMPIAGKVIVKSGFGTAVAIKGRYLHPTVFYKSVGLARCPEHLYELQEYIEAEREVRSYAFKHADGHVRFVHFSMPTGVIGEPDWRVALPASEIAVSKIESSELDNLAGAILMDSALIYVCVDVVFSDDCQYIVDVNPHGSWFWLPAFANQIVTIEFSKMLDSYQKGESNGNFARRKNTGRSAKSG